MTDTNTVINTITLPLTDEEAKKLAAIPQGTANHTHTFSTPDKVIEAEEIN